MDSIKGTMTEIYNDLSKSTSGNTIAEVNSRHIDQCLSCKYLASFNLRLFLPQIRRLRIEIEKLQWLHQQELSEMKHNLGKILAICRHTSESGFTTESVFS